MSRVVAQDVVDQTVIDTLTETNLFVGTIPSGVWVGNTVMLEQTGRYQNSGNAQTYRTRLYVGSTAGAGGTLVTDFTSPSQASSSSGMAAMQRWKLIAIDSDSLRIIHSYSFGGLGSDGGAFAAVTNPGGFVTNKVDGLSLSGAVEIRITVTLSSVSGTTHQFSSRGVWAALVDEAEEAAATTTTSLILAGI